jgi:DNA-binding transcriptional LysR family regulator
MLREYELLQQDLHSRENTPVGNLLIGAVPTAMPIAARFAAMLHDLHPGIAPAVRSMSSVELETGIENLALDMGLGYPERMQDNRSTVRVVPQYTEHYFLLRRAAVPDREGLRIGPPITWKEAAALPLCMLSPEMYNRTIMDRAFGEVGAHPKPAIETNSVLTLALSVRAGRVVSVMPGALVDDVHGYRELEALPLTEPAVEVPIAFMVHDGNRPSRTLEAALAFAQDPAWLGVVARHAGGLASGVAEPSEATLG